MTGILNLLLGAGGVIKDTYFNLVSLLLPGNGTNGAQNNTFLDSSTNNFTITRNGNTTQGTFSPFSQTGWGNYFDGSGDYLTTPNNSALYLTTNNFTLEGWIYLASTSTTQNIVRGANSFSIGILQSSGSLIYYISSNGSSWDIASAVSMGSITANAWVHFALVRNGSTFTPYINGVAGTTTTSSSSIANTNGLIVFAETGGTLPATGYCSNLRLVNGTAVYTAAFTPPTSPLTAITNTSLLTCQSNRFRDASTNNFTITANGNTSVVAFSPFAPTAAYTTAAVGGSGYFDGTGDYLTAPSNIVDFAAGQAFTVECWVYLSSNTPAQAISANGANTFSLAISGGQVLYGKAGVIDVLVGTMAAANQWVHIAVGRNSSNTSRLWVNGTSVATSGSDTYSFNAATMYIGSNSTPAAYLNGYMAGLRVVKGSDVYGVANTSITVPTAPLTAITNTSLLLNFTNAGITDATAKNDLETVGNAQISTSVSKFGGGSIAFDGTGDYLYKPYDPLLNQLNGNFTIECWIYPTVTSTSMLFAGSANAAGSTNWYFEISATNKLRFVWDSTTTSFAATSTGNISANVWTYVAAVKNGGTITLYINGSADGTSSPTGTFKNGSFGTAIGRAGEYNGQYFTGYIDDFRMTIGQARTITASPSAPFPVQ